MRTPREIISMTEHVFSHKLQVMMKLEMGLITI